ncbi:MAG: hypothetical protein R2713_24170 [Ilumatobacteraceae bacterium]
MSPRCPAASSTTLSPSFCTSEPLTPSEYSDEVLTCARSMRRGTARPSPSRATATIAVVSAAKVTKLAYEVFERECAERGEHQHHRDPHPWNTARSIMPSP